MPFDIDIFISLYKCKKMERTKREEKIVNKSERKKFNPKRRKKVNK